MSWKLKHMENFYFAHPCFHHKEIISAILLLFFLVFFSLDFKNFILISVVHPISLLLTTGTYCFLYLWQILINMILNGCIWFHCMEMSLFLIILPLDDFLLFFFLLPIMNKLGCNNSLWLVFAYHLIKLFCWSKHK